MSMTRVFVISAVQCLEAVEQVNEIVRHLDCRANDVTLFDMSLLKEEDDSVEILRQLKDFDLLRTADATILITDEYCASLTQSVQSLFKTPTKTKRSSNVWNHNGICCTILGGSIKKSRVAKQLWEVFSEQHDLDFTSIFRSPLYYNYVDYTKETAQPTVV